MTSEGEAPTAKYEDVSAFKLSNEEISWLYENQPECVLNWTTSEGFPMGMPHNYVCAEGSFWIGMGGHRKRVKAMRARPQTCLVISSNGTGRGVGEWVAIKAIAKIHDDRDRLRWFLPLFLERIGYPPEAFDDFFTPRQVVVEFEPVQVLTFSAAAMAAARAGQ